ncbi:MAG: ABC transporter permease [Trueperaceae bacterium]
MTTSTPTVGTVSGQARDEGLHAAFTAGTRPPPASSLSVVFTFAWRALLKIKHVPEQLFDVTAFPLMMTLMFTYLFGGAIAGSTSEYLQFLLPGIFVQTVVFITLYTAVGLNTDISKGMFDRFRSLPIWRPAPLVGALLGDTVRYVMAASVVMAVGLILGFRPAGGAVGVLLALALLLLFAFSLTWIWTVLGILMQTPNAVMMTSMLVLFPITFGSNIYVDPSTMPGWLQAFIGVNPIARLVTAVRGLMHGAATFDQILWVFGASAVIVAIFAPLTMYLYYRRE